MNVRSRSAAGSLLVVFRLIVVRPVVGDVDGTVSSAVVSELEEHAFLRRGKPVAGIRVARAGPLCDVGGHSGLQVDARDGQVLGALVWSELIAFALTLPDEGAEVRLVPAEDPSLARSWHCC